MKFFSNYRRHFLVALHDTVMAGVSFILALYLRLGDDFAFTKPILLATLLCPIVCLAVFSYMQLYRGLWRYASTQDLVVIGKSAVSAILLFYLAIFLINRLDGIPRSAPFIQLLLLLALLGTPRFLYRIWRDKQLGISTGLVGDNRIPVILIGSGDRAELFLRDSRSGPSSGYVVVGIIDDNQSRIGHTIHNVKIYGNLDEFPKIVDKLARRGLKPQKAILTYDTMEGSKIRRLFEATDKLGIPLARMPKLSEFKQGMQDKVEIRPIAVEDLLGRSQNVQNKQPVEDFIKGKTVLVSGAGGTIGSELVRQIAELEPAKIVLFELSEFALYTIDMEIAGAFPYLPRVAVIGDVRHREHLDAVFASEKPQIVFHAAAIKHVPLAEANVEEAILTNIFGSQAIADACVKAEVEVMVMISTDKAVNPSSLMGASKRAAESYCQAVASGKTRFVTVRFGNVLGSNGSVVPLFRKQLAEGGPITVTHKDMVRYFMTVREAVELVLQTTTLGNQSGNIYVLDMGQPVKILDLAEQMIKLAGLKPGIDIKIEFTGLRPGEKMFEELFHESEQHSKTEHESIWLANPRSQSPEFIAGVFAKLFDACNRRNPTEAIALLREIVPEYV